MDDTYVTSCGTSPNILESELCKRLSEFSHIRPLPGLWQFVPDGPEKSVGTEYTLLIGERKGKFELCLSRFDYLKT